MYVRNYATAQVNNGNTVGESVTLWFTNRYTAKVGYNRWHTVLKYDRWKYEAIVEYNK